MRQFFGIGALVGLVVALAMALMGIAGLNIPEEGLAWLPWLAMIEFIVALVVLLVVFRRGVHFVVPREVSAGALFVVMVLVLAVVTPGRLADGRPKQVDVQYFVVDQQGKVLRELPEHEYLAARRSENRVECAAMALFLYLATLALLLPAATWSPARARRWGDWAGAAHHVRGADAAP